MIKLYKISVDDIEDFSIIDSFPKNIKKRIEDKKNPLSRKQSIVGYYLLMKGAKELFGIENLEVDFTENGKPITNSFFFSISHSEKLVACAFSDKPIGLDVQNIRYIAINDHIPFFTDKDINYIKSCESGQIDRFFEVFTKKEALVKLYGAKLTDCNKLSTKNISFNFFKEDNYILCIAESIDK